MNDVEKIPWATVCVFANTVSLFVKAAAKSTKGFALS